MTLPEPYYCEDGITIYCGDCREILPEIEGDVMVTDPPYGVGFAGKATKWHRARGGYTVPDDPEIGPEAILAALSRVKRAAVFPGVRRMYDYPPPADVGCVFCPSGAGRGRWGFTLFNPILYYGKRPPKGPGMTPASIESFALAGAEGHPCPKPLEWMTWLVERTSIPGETVLDPFMGSGSTLVAAKLLGRRAIGIEIEERYCEVAVQRLAQGVLPLEATR